MVALVLLAISNLHAADYAAPAGELPVVRRPGAASILPGGRLIAPLGSQQITGPGPFGLSISPDGKIVVSANGGPQRFSLTVLERDGEDRWRSRHLLARTGKEQDEEDDWRSVFMGLAFSGNRTLFASEGNSGRVRELNVSTGSPRRVYNLNENGFADSYTGDLALDRERKLLHVVDQANFRLVTIDTDQHRIVASLRLGRLPFAISLSPDGRRAYVTNIGMFEYQGVPGADPKQARETGLPFPAFGFPSEEARQGAVRETARGPVKVPGLGGLNVREANSVAVVNLEDPAAPRVEAFIPTGLPVGGAVAGGSSPSGIVAAADRVYVSNAHNDSITVIDAKTNQVAGEIPLRIPGLENLRGILPIGLALDPQSGRLLAAEAGINAVGVIDTRQVRVLGHLPVGWFPTRVVLDRGSVYVSNAKGHGVGPNADRAGNPIQTETFLSVLRRGTVSIFPLPAEAELARHTGRVMALNGFLPAAKPAALPLPEAVRHVVLIVKENRTFDEVFGDLAKASNGPVRAAGTLARFGRQGYVDGGGRRLSLQKVNVTPNHHAMADRWAFSDNFYADSEVSVDGHHWLVGSYPNAWTESSLMAAYGGQKDFRFPTTAPGRLLFAGSNSSVHPEEVLEAGAIWHHLDRHGVSFRNYGEGFELAGADEGPGLEPTGARFLTNMPMPDPLYRNTSRRYPMYNMNIPDQYRATAFIEEIEENHVKGGEPFPRFIFIHLPNDHMARPRPDDGYPYQASFVADNDYALGRIVEYLSNTKWWREMAVFITEDDAQGGRDHVDAHRTVLLVAGPYVKKNYVSHRNASFPGLLKTIFRLLGLPPLNLFDAAATDLSDCFTGTPDFTPYR
ncbi:MAG: bifunctional YncE family protein/alkaline phosphatase family protein, partial [Bryobacterales bacterium]|nr:bifunctional YncE family protein/alkaline phosphatase family protein [Bryobacterales bacterium]